MRVIPQPEIQSVHSLELPGYESFTLDNGLSVHTLAGGSEPVLKLELVFRAGASFEVKPAAAEVMAALMAEGTAQRSSAALAESMESLGATLQTRGGVDTVRVRLYTLTRFFPELIGLVGELVREPAFDPDELSVYTNNKIERLQIDLKKNETIAYRYLTEAIFGPGHPYGRNHHPEDYRALVREDLLRHHQANIRPDRAMAFLSGHFGLPEIDLFRDTFGTWKAPSRVSDPSALLEATSRTGRLDVPGPQQHQAAIRIGRRLFPESHPDFYGVYVLNTLLGGYFGSRLMTEIRENQGLTYGIYSSVDSFAQDGCFYISTETTTDQVEKMLAAIRTEIDRLRHDLIPVEELTMARNYLMGHLMTQIDGPLASMDYIKTMKIEGLSDAHFARMVDTVLTIDPGQLRDLAQTYLDPEAWITIVVA